jgi:hypothetical protein
MLLQAFEPKDILKPTALMHERRLVPLQHIMLNGCNSVKASKGVKKSG